MLPFLKPRKTVSVIMAKSKPDGSIEHVGVEGEPNYALMSASEDLIRAIHAKDAKAVAEAMQAAFDCCEMQDYPEDEHMDEGEEV